MQASLTVPHSVPPALIEVERLSRVVGAGSRKTVMVEEITFTVQSATLFAITGPSGSGKSTILNLLSGIDRPTTGRIWVAGDELHPMSEDRLAHWRGRHVGIVFQFFQLLPTLTALENVLLALELGGGGGLCQRRRGNDPAATEKRDPPLGGVPWVNFVCHQSRARRADEN
jgi:predicted ABC-type transport system involved in lysophospholipase L1 biosynthesis ATPase subunit